MTITTAPNPTTPPRWAVSAVLDYLNGEADHHSDIAKRLRYADDIDRQEQIINAIKAVRDLAAATFPSP
ncbi:hypothetical protein [Actinomadura sp. DC4]|uniref:hypothetical protein n=1 Tax=Actinomadura sp. DC4 TaxID=3055069 RepID=UPI0025B0EE44|nr:hypothetical protein [Actinomadura sp. DC4]MDN3354369.1 hypothetical protein [Actinomadura sp. DC4]